jgi:hypothetical protein
MGLAANDDKRNQIRKYWDGMIEGMGKKDLGLFLRHIWVSKYGDLKNIDLFSALKKHIEDKNINSVDFAKTCSEECDRYIEVVRASKEDLGDAAKHIDTLVNDLGFDVTLPLLLSAHATLDNADLEKVARLILVFVTRYTILLGLDFSGLENTTFALAREIRSLPKAKIVAHIKSTLVKRAPDNKQIEAMKLDSEDMLFEQQDAVYVMSRLANRLQSQTKEVALNETNLEHIFPKNPSPEWTNADDLEPYLWHIGNLTMLGKRLNSAIANSGFPKKKAYYTKNTELAITKKIAAEYQKWDVAAVHKRTKQLLPVVMEIWDFNNTSRV